MAGNSAISQRGFAKEIGKSPTWVNKLISEGILPRNNDGSLPYEEALAAYKSHIAKRKGADETKEIINDASMNINAAINKVKLAKETYNARLKELEYKMRKGELLEKDFVVAEAARMAEAVRNKLLSLPARVAALCENRTSREIEGIIENEINEILGEFKNSKL